jgi:6-pyruvoyltetrahydropterin/6-carboxytetrahydropterin synthase
METVYAPRKRVPTCEIMAGRYDDDMGQSRLVELQKTWHFESARKLTGIGPDHRCARIHGSSFHVEVTVRAHVHPVTGWCVDFDAMEQTWGKLHDQLDHRLLNDVEGLENPTTEHIAMWILDRIRFADGVVTKVTVAELPTAKVTVFAEGV